MIERRKFIRLQAPIGVTYKVLKKIKRAKSSQTLIKNIGGGGIRIMTKDDLKSGDLVELAIEIPHLKEPIRAVGEVVWFAHFRDRDREGREAGIRFRDIEPKNLHRVLEFVHTIGIG